MEDVSLPAFILLSSRSQKMCEQVMRRERSKQKKAKYSILAFYSVTHATRVKVHLTLLRILVLLLNLKLAMSLGTIFAIQYHTHFFIYVVTEHFTCLLTDCVESKLILYFRSGESRRHPPNI